VARVGSADGPLTTREQSAAIAELRWRIFVNSLRTQRGRMELVARIFAGFGYSVMGIGGTFGLGIAAWFMVTRDALRWLALPLWFIFLYWQLFPVMATAFAENFDAANFLRFPLTYRSYFLMRIVYGVLDPTSLISVLWLAGLTVGIGAGAPRLFLWAVVVMAAFAAFNILLSRAIFSWVERWLAQRKTREIFGFFFFLFIIGSQFISPVMRYYFLHYGPAHRPQMIGSAAELLAIDRFLPPGLASVAVTHLAQREFGGALGALALLCVYSAAFLALLNVRLRAQYAGENLSEARAPAAIRTGKQTVRAGWSVSGLSGPVTAIVEKEFRYLLRSGPMLFTFIMPVVILLIFRFSMANAPRGGRMLQHNLDLAFPAGAAYAMLILSNMIFNSFGADGGGVQFFFMAPVRFRDILLAKNLGQASILALEMTAVWVGASLLYRPPSFAITIATLAAALFATPVNFIAGDLLSLYSPKKFDFAVLGRQRASSTTGFASLGVQLVTLGIAGPSIALAYHFERLWIATGFLLLLAAGVMRGYAYMLSRIDALALRRRESMISELCRTS